MAVDRVVEGLNEIISDRVTAEVNSSEGPIAWFSGAAPDGRHLRFRS